MEDDVRIMIALGDQLLKYLGEQFGRGAPAADTLRTSVVIECIAPR
jgi:hypothetical protein